MADHSPRFLKLVESIRPSIKECDIHHVQHRLERKERFLLIDVREESEWSKGHLSGAIHLGKGIIERDIEKAVPNPATEVILYCGGGFRSAIAAEALARMGYTHVVSMDGGYRAWCDAGFPIVR